MIRVSKKVADGGGGAVISVSYSEEFYGQTLTATNGTDTVTKVAPSTGSVDINVPSEGTWTVSCTVSGKTFTSDEISVDVEPFLVLNTISFCKISPSTTIDIRTVTSSASLVGIIVTVLFVVDAVLPCLT